MGSYGLWSILKTTTMKALPILIVIILLISCRESHDKKHIDFVSKIESIGIDKFKNIDFGTRGDHEVYSYYLTNDSSISWTYNRESKEFEFPIVPQDFKRIAIDYESYINGVRNEIHSLDVIMITQSPWIGNIIRFWITDKEIIEYVNPEFKFDDRFKNEWLKEIKTGQKLKDNWYYKKIQK